MKKTIRICICYLIASTLAVERYDTHTSESIDVPRQLEGEEYAFEFTASEKKLYVGNGMPTFLKEFVDERKPSGKYDRTINDEWVSETIQFKKNSGQFCNSSKINKKICFKSQSAARSFAKKPSKVSYGMRVSTYFADLETLQINRDQMETFVAEAMYRMYSNEMYEGRTALGVGKSRTATHELKDNPCHVVFGGGNYFKECKEKCRRGACWTECKTPQVLGCSAEQKIYVVPQFGVITILKNGHLVASAHIEFKSYAVKSGPMKIRFNYCSAEVSLSLSFLSFIPGFGPLFSTAGLLRNLFCVIPGDARASERINTLGGVELIPRDVSRNGFHNYQSNMYDCAKCWPEDVEQWRDNQWYNVSEASEDNNLCQYCWSQQEILDSQEDFADSINEDCDQILDKDTDYLQSILPIEERGQITDIRADCLNRSNNESQRNVASGTTVTGMTGGAFALGAVVSGLAVGLVYSRRAKSDKGSDQVIESFKSGV